LQGYKLNPLGEELPFRKLAPRNAQEKPALEGSFEVKVGLKQFNPGGIVPTATTRRTYRSVEHTCPS